MRLFTGTGISTHSLIMPLWGSSLRLVAEDNNCLEQSQAQSEC